MTITSSRVSHHEVARTSSSDIRSKSFTIHTQHVLGSFPSTASSSLQRSSTGNKPLPRASRRSETATPMTLVTRAHRSLRVRVPPALPDGHAVTVDGDEALKLSLFRDVLADDNVLPLPVTHVLVSVAGFHFWSR